MERRSDSGHRDRIDEIATNYDRFNKRVLLLMFLLVGTTFGFGALSVWLAIENSHRSHEALVLSQEIQDERAEATRTNCENQNDRHDATISKLNDIVAAAIKKDPSREAQLKASVKPNIILINALVPKRNCEKLAQQAVRANTITTQDTP